MISKSKSLCWSTLALTIFIHLCSGFMPKCYENSLWKNHDYITRRAAHYVAAEAMNDNPINGSLQIEIDYTKEALTGWDMFKKYYAGRPQIPSVKPLMAAVTELAEAASFVEVNPSTRDNPDFFFNAERFYESNRKVVDSLVSAVGQIRASNFDGARQVVGTALHIVQDFYAHTSWVETERKINPGIGDLGANFQVASPWTATCINCSNPLGQCNYNLLILSTLTSGYKEESFKGPQVDDAGNSFPKPAHKCGYGGSLDSGIGKSPFGGINKDTSNCHLSPHCNWHDEAVELAVRASVHFLNKVRQAVNNDMLFGRFLGINDGRSLVIIMDTTGSMGPYIDAVKMTVQDLVDRWRAEQTTLTDYVLVPFNDPDFGPVQRTSDSEQFKKWVNALYPGGGGDEPEMHYSGLKLAVDAALPGSPLFSFTDASAKDDHLKEAVIATAQSKGLSIYMLIGGAVRKEDTAQNSGTERDNISSLRFDHQNSESKISGDVVTEYEDVCKVTGGVLFKVTTSTADTIKANSVIESLTSLRRVIIDRRQYQIALGSNSMFTFYVDPAMSTFTVMVTSSTQINMCTVMEIRPLLPSPTQTPTITCSSSMYNYHQVNPSIGHWQVIISNTQASMVTFSTITLGNSNWDVLADIYYPINDHPSGCIQRVRGNPISGVNAFIEVQQSSDQLTLDELHLIHPQTGDIIYTGKLDPLGPPFFFGKQIQIPTQPFVFKFKSINSTEVASRFETNIYKPTVLSLIVRVENASAIVYRGRTVEVSLTVNNIGPSTTVTINWFSSSSSISASITNPSFILGTNSTMVVKSIILASPSAPLGDYAKVQLHASNSVGERNYQEISLTVRAIEETFTEPTFEIQYESYNNTCLFHDPRYCYNNWWNATVFVKDMGSGMASAGISTIYDINGTQLNWNTTVHSVNLVSNVIPNNPPGTVFSIHLLPTNCCIQSVVITGYNKIGLSKSIILGRERPDPIYWDIPTTSLPSSTLITSPPEDGTVDGKRQIRLVNNETIVYIDGRLEVLSTLSPEGWGLICADGFNGKAAEVACRQLTGRSTYAGEVYGEKYGSSKWPVLFTNFFCQGNENALSLCSHYYNRSGVPCKSHRIIGVDCMKTADTRPPNVTLNCSLGGFHVKIKSGSELFTVTTSSICRWPASGTNFETGFGLRECGSTMQTTADYFAYQNELLATIQRGGEDSPLLWTFMYRLTCLQDRRGGANSTIFETSVENTNLDPNGTIALRISMRLYSDAGFTRPLAANDLVNPRHKIGAMLAADAKPDVFDETLMHLRAYQCKLLSDSAEDSAVGYMMLKNSCPPTDKNVLDVEIVPSIKPKEVKFRFFPAAFKLDKPLSRVLCLVKICLNENDTSPECAPANCTAQHVQRRRHGQNEFLTRATGQMQEAAKSQHYEMAVEANGEYESNGVIWWSKRNSQPEEDREEKQTDILTVVIAVGSVLAACGILGLIAVGVVLVVKKRRNILSTEGSSSNSQAQLYSEKSKEETQF